MSLIQKIVRPARYLSLCVAAGVLFCPQASGAESWVARPIVVHEWGVNVFDWSGGLHDPQFPAFCYTDERPGEVLGQPQQRARDLPPDSGIRTKPVLYFYLPEHSQDVPIDVETRFAFGHAAAWYPQVSVYRTPEQVAEAEPIDWEAWREDTNRAQLRFGGELAPVPEDERFELVWNGLTLNPELPDAVRYAEQGLADDHWWRIARDVPSAFVSNGGEAERFLFYEGATRELPAIAVVDHYDFMRQSGAKHVVNVSDEPIYDVLVIYRAPDGRRWVSYQSELEPIPIHAPNARPIQQQVQALTIPDFDTLANHHWLTNLDEDRFARQTYDRVYDAMIDGGVITPGFLIRDPADPQPATLTHALTQSEAQVALDIWEDDFFGADGVTILYRESPAYLDRAMPLHIFTDMFHYIELSRCGWVLNQNVPVHHADVVHQAVLRLVHESWQDTPEGRRERADAIRMCRNHRMLALGSLAYQERLHGGTMYRGDTDRGEAVRAIINGTGEVPQPVPGD